MDPRTLLLIVDADRRGDDDDRARQLGRIEALRRKNAQTAVEPVVGGPDARSHRSAITVCLGVVVAIAAGAAAVPAVTLISAFALGVGRLACVHVPGAGRQPSPMTVEECRHLYPAEGPNAVRVEMSLQGISARGVAIVVMG